MKTQVLLGLLVYLAIARGGFSVHAEEGHLLAEKGSTEYVIVLDVGATPPERTAARELQMHLGAVSGARFDIVTLEPKAAAPPKGLYVGVGERFKATVPGLEKLGADGIRVFSQGDRIFFGGEGARGTLYSIYVFLEDEIGIRWWTPTETEILCRPRLFVSRQDLAYAPPIRVRETFYYHAFDPIFAARNRLNGSCQHVPESHGGHHRILGWCHTFFPLLPPDTYFAEHPEWYSLIDGERVDDGQLFLTNEEMRVEFIRNAMEWVRADPEAGIISISQNDWGNPCECSACRALVEKEGSQAGPIIDFVNAVAEAVEVESPEFLDGYYGPAGKFLWKTIQITREAVAKADVNLRCFRRTTADWLGLRDFNRITKLFNKAARAVAGDAVLEQRLYTVRMPVDYVWLRRYNAFLREAERERLSFHGPADPVAARDAFLRKINLMDCAEFGEGHPFEGAFPGLSRLFMDDRPVPLEYQSLDRDDYVYRPARNKGETMGD